MKHKPAMTKPIKRSTYFVATGILALLVSGTMAFFLAQPQWKLSFSYQYMGKPDTGTAHASSSGSLLHDIQEAQGAASSETSLMAQIALLQNQQFLKTVQAKLETVGIQGWPAEKLARVMKITNPLHSNFIQIEVQTPQKEATRQIAALVHQSYTEYMQAFQREMIQKERAFVESSLSNAKSKLAEGDKNLRSLLSNDASPSTSRFTSDPSLGGKALIQEFEALGKQIKDAEALIAFEDTTYSNYSSLLNKDEKSLMEGVILGEDPVLNKLSEQLATAQTDANILSIKYTPEDAAATGAQVKSIEQLIEAQRQQILNGKSAQGKPVIRDSLRKGFVQELLSSKIRLKAATKQRDVLVKQRDNLLQRLDQMASTAGDYNAWMLQKDLLQNTVASLQKRADDLDYQLENLSLPVKLFGTIPTVPSQVHNTSSSLVFFLATFSGLFCLLGAMPLVMDYRATLIPTRSMLGILKELLSTKGQQVIVMLPVYSSGHLNAALHLGGLLNQFGRDAVVIDTDLSHRLLSRKVHGDHPYGVFEHLLDSDMKKPYLDALSGAKMIPLEATLSADKIVEFSQVVQRLPRIWERWPGSVVILDISKWHEAYHQLLPFVSQVIFYVPPSHQTSTLLPKVFKSKYHVPVSLVEIQPEL